MHFVRYLFYFILFGLASLLVACTKSGSSAPKLSFDSFIPSDTLKRYSTLKINLKFEDADGDLDSIWISKAVKESTKDSAVLSYKLPVEKDIYEGNLLIQFYNGQGINDNSIVSIIDPKYGNTSLKYTVSYQIVVKDAKFNRSDTLRTSSILVLRQ